MSTKKEGIAVAVFFGIFGASTFGSAVYVATLQGAHWYESFVAAVFFGPLIALGGWLGCDIYHEARKQLPPTAAGSQE